jgi:glycosyltransferase involved in cell wall biosynthesis
MSPPNGESCVNAWVLQALIGHYDLTVVTRDAPNIEALNTAFGTSLTFDEIHFHVASPIAIKSLHKLPLPLALLEKTILFRSARKLCGSQTYDAVLSTVDETDLGFKLIQYIHFPHAKFPKPGVRYRWYHATPLLYLYHSLNVALSDYDVQRVVANVTLVNSDWTGRFFRDWYGVAARTVYPPVSNKFHSFPFGERRKGFICLSRISPEKELEKVVTIIEKVRELGHDVTLNIIGPLGERKYAENFLASCIKYSEWLSVQCNLPWDQVMNTVAMYRYGIHGMVGEHFGIAPAELQRAECITFVPDDGGVVEIVENDDRFVYHSIDDAVSKIQAMLSSDVIENNLLRAVMTRKDKFSETRFMRDIQDVVSNFIIENAG